MNLIFFDDLNRNFKQFAEDRNTWGTYMAKIMIALGFLGF